MLDIGEVQAGGGCASDFGSVETPLIRERTGACRTNLEMNERTGEDDLALRLVGDDRRWERKALFGGEC